MTASMQLQDPIGNIASRLAHSSQAEVINTLDTFLLANSTAPRATPAQPADSSVLNPEIRACLPAPVCAAIDGLVAFIAYCLDRRQPTADMAVPETDITEGIVTRGLRRYRSGAQRTEVQTTMGPIHYRRSCYRCREARRYCPLDKHAGVTAGAARKALLFLTEITPRQLAGQIRRLGGKMPLRGKKGNRTVDWREASCATVSYHDRDGKSLRTIRHGRMPQSGELDLKRWLAAEKTHINGRRADLKLVAIADGSPNNWSFLGPPDAAGEHLMAHRKDQFEANNCPCEKQTMGVKTP